MRKWHSPTWKCKYIVALLFKEGPTEILLVKDTVHENKKQYVNTCINGCLKKKMEKSGF